MSATWVRVAAVIAFAGAFFTLGDNRLASAICAIVGIALVVLSARMSSDREVDHTARVAQEPAPAPVPDRRQIDDEVAQFSDFLDGVRPEDFERKR